MLQLKLSYGTEKISCLMSRHYIDTIIQGLILVHIIPFIQNQ